MLHLSRQWDMHIPRRMPCTNERPFAEVYLHNTTSTKDICASRGIRTRDPSNRETATGIGGENVMWHYKARNEWQDADDGESWEEDSGTGTGIKQHPLETGRRKIINFNWFVFQVFRISFVHEDITSYICRQGLLKGLRVQLFREMSVMMYTMSGEMKLLCAIVVMKNCFSASSLHYS